MADITIDSGAYASSFFRFNGERRVFKTDQIVYEFFVINAGLKYRKSTDGGQTWAAAVTVMSIDAVTGAIWYDRWTPGDTGTKVHCLAANWTSDNWQYRTLDISSDTLGTQRTPAATGMGHPATINDNFVSITKAMGGRIYVAGHVAGSGDAFVVSDDSGATWTAKTSPWESSDEDRFRLIPSNEAGSTNDCACVFLDDSADELSVKLYASGANTWGHETVVTTLAATDWADTHWGFAVAIRHSDKKAIIAAWNAINASTADLTASEVVLNAAGIAVTAKTNVLTDRNTAGECAILIDQNTSNIYVAYNYGGTWDSSCDAYYKQSTDGMSTWGTETKVNVTTADIRSVSLGGSIASGDSGRLQVSWTVQGASDSITTNYTNSASILAGATSVSDPPFPLAPFGSVARNVLLRM